MTSAQYPDWVRSPRTRMDADFAEFHKRNPHIYAEVEERIFKLLDAGMRKVGIALVFESMRYDAAIRTDTRNYKLNNNFRSLYSRMFLHFHPELVETLEIRRQRVKAPA